MVNGNIIILYVLTFNFLEAGGTIKFSQVNSNMVSLPCGGGEI